MQYMIILLILQREIKKTFPPTKRWQRKAKSNNNIKRKEQNV